MNNETEITIIEAAAKLLLKENYQNMKTASIAREAGVAEGTLYRYFKSKKDILICVLTHYYGNIMPCIFNEVTKEKTIEENLSILVDNFLIQLEEKVSFFKLVYKTFSEIEDEEVKKVFNNFYIEINEKILTVLKWGNINDYLKDDESLELIAMIISGTKDMFIQNYLFGIKKSLNKEMMQKIKNLFIRLIKK